MFFLFFISKHVINFLRSFDCMRKTEKKSVQTKKKTNETKNNRISLRFDCAENFINFLSFIMMMYPKPNQNTRKRNIFLTHKMEQTKKIYIHFVGLSIIMKMECYIVINNLLWKITIFLFIKLKCLS